MITKNSHNFISVISKLKPDQFEALIDNLSEKAINDIGECVYNAIYTDLHLSSKKKSYLKRHIKKNCCVKKIKTITTKTAPLSKRRMALKQSGKGLPLILASVIPFIASLFRRS